VNTFWVAEKCEKQWNTIQQEKRVADNHRMECCSTHGRRKRGSSSQVQTHKKKKGKKKKKKTDVLICHVQNHSRGERERNGQAHRK
jgi:hypothetical protein